ncbi:MAG TPA: hypothetical protein VFN61_11310 [Acidimicrobiales bacterium]|nr:hypothetical protein [Acidimicrobiales bacterium]
MLATALSCIVASSAPAGAVGIGSACGSGVELKNCPPLCAKLMTAAQISAVFHVKLGKGTWHVDGEPADTCTYAELSNSSATVTDEVDPHQSVADFKNQVSVQKQFNRNAKMMKVPALGANAVEFVTCMGTGPYAMCFPNFVVLQKGFLVQASEALNGIGRAQMQAKYAPLVQAWVKALLAKA